MSADERWLHLRGAATGHKTSLEIGAPRDGTFSPDGKLFAAASRLGFARLWETATFRDFLLGVHSVAFSPDGKRLAAGSSGQEVINLWDILLWPFEARILCNLSPAFL